MYLHYYANSRVVWYLALGGLVWYLALGGVHNHTTPLFLLALN